MGSPPDFIDPLLGWRAWNVIRDMGHDRLASLVFPTVWRPRRPHLARCVSDSGRRRHPAPRLGCHCGLYAAATASSASAFAAQWTWVRHPVEHGTPIAIAIGQVWMWGRVIEGEHGWRASAAYPASLIIVQGHLSDAEAGALRLQLESTYGVPAEISAALQYA